MLFKLNCYREERLLTILNQLFIELCFCIERIMNNNWTVKGIQLDNFLVLNSNGPPVRIKY